MNREKRTIEIIDNFPESVESIKSARLIADYWPDFDSLGFYPYGDIAQGIIKEEQARWLRYVSDYVQSNFQRRHWEAFLKDSSQVAIERALKAIQNCIEEIENSESE